MQSMKKDNEFGVDGYNLATTMTNFDKPICTKLVSGQKKTFVDDAVKAKRHVPDAKYDVSLNWVAPNKRSNFCKDKRHTIATDIERVTKRETRPNQHTYSPSHKLVEPKVLASLNMKGKRDDTSFLAQPMF